LDTPCKIKDLTTIVSFFFIGWKPRLPDPSLTKGVGCIESGLINIDYLDFSYKEFN